MNHGYSELQNNTFILFLQDAVPLLRIYVAEGVGEVFCLEIEKGHAEAGLQKTEVCRFRRRWRSDFYDEG